MAIGKSAKKTATSKKKELVLVIEYIVELDDIGTVSTALEHLEGYGNTRIVDARVEEVDV